MHLKIRTHKAINLLVKCDLLLSGKTKPGALKNKLPGKHLDPRGKKYVGSVRRTS
jgi:hypothetical protein